MEKSFWEEMKAKTPEPSEDERKRAKEEWEKLPEEEKRKRTITIEVLKEYFESLYANDLIGAAKSIGKLELINPGDAFFYSGQIREKGEDYKGAIKDFLQVEVDSDRYRDAVIHLENSYMMSGDYVGLDELYKREKFSDIHKFEHRMNCLFRISNEQFEEIKEEINRRPFETIETLEHNEENMHSFHWICRMLAVLFSISGEMISECNMHQIWTGNPIDGNNIDPDIMEYVQVYERFVFILKKTESLKIIKFQGQDDMSLAKLALCELPWQEKLVVFRNPNYVQEAAKIIAGLLNPQYHPANDPYSLLHELMDHFSHINPQYIQAVISEAFDVVSSAARKGDESAIYYLGFAFADIVATGSDTYRIKDRINEVLTNIPDYSIGEILNSRKLVTALSRKAFEALKNAEGVFQSTKSSKYHIGDASVLALMYFRIIEMEYNDKFIIPFAKQLDYDKLNRLCGAGKKDSDKTEDERRNEKRWRKDIDMLQEVASGGRASIGLGSVRILLIHIKEQYGTCGIIMYKALQNILTPEGLHAYVFGPMISLISDIKVTKYRNPGAHTGYLPYSEACKARELVMSNAHMISEWFKKDSLIV